MVRQDFASTRPYLYHLTDRSNLDRIRETGNLFSAARLIELAGRSDLLRQRRRGHTRILVGDAEISLRDQDPLYEGNILLPDGYTYEDLVQSLNEKVFFWPGTHVAPNAYGVRHFQRYESDRPVILRTRLQSLVAANAAIGPLFCKYNSGAPRCSNGKKSPRGPDTFVSASDFNGTPSQVVEVVFSGAIILPADVEYGTLIDERWQVQI